MSVYYGYKNRLWKQVNVFSFTGSPQQFTLQPGTYLLECCGALGGISKQQNSFRAYGGVSYGILSLEEAKTMYAYVGGNGEDVPDEQPTAGRGGWNGGGNGGLGSVGYYGGAGGGGASDIRLKLPEDFLIQIPVLPEGYQQIEYVESTGSQYIDLGQLTHDTLESVTFTRPQRMQLDYYCNGNSVIELDCSLPAPVNTYDTPWGSRGGADYFIAYNGGTLRFSFSGTMGNVGSIANYYNKRITIILSRRYCKMICAGIEIYNVAFNGGSTQATVPIGIATLFTDASGGDYSDCRTNMTVYGLRIYENETLVKEYIPFRDSSDRYCIKENGSGTLFYSKNTDVTGAYGVSDVSFGFRASVVDNNSNMVIVGSRYDDNAGNRFDVHMKKLSVPSINAVYGNRTDDAADYVATDIESTDSGRYFISPDEVYVDDNQIASYTKMGYPGLKPFYLMACYQEDTYDGVEPSTFFTGKLYHFRVYDGIAVTARMIKELIPCIRTFDQTIGMYDTINNQFYQSSGDPLVAGPEGSYPIQADIREDPAILAEKSLNTRIIVAGGSGGSGSFDYESNKSPNYANFGGGKNGGPLFAVNCGNANGKYASQIDGNKFGTGQDAANRSSGSYNDNGASGGGGGWYGGYAIQTTNTYGLAGPGGGGSGFVYTDSSDIPLDYLVDENYQLTSSYMCANKSTQSSIRILEPISEDSLESGDIIKFIPTGDMSSVTLNPGTYLLKCKGCDGSVRYTINDSPRGGYSEGVLTLSEPTELRAFVGGTGIGDNLLSSSYVRETFPDIAANGGGMPRTLGGGFTGHSGGAGSGATDFRIVSGGIDILPDGYTQLEYFRVSGTQYLDTDYILSTNDDVSIECAKYASDASSWKSFGGSMISERNNDFSLWTTSNSRISMHRGSTNDDGPSFSVAIGTKFTIGNVSNNLVVNGTIYSTVTNTPYTCPVSFYLGCNHYPSTTSNHISNIQYYHFYIHNNGSLVVDMYPCIEMSTGIVGMYDIVRDRFYPGTGGLIAGPAVYGSASAFTRVIVAGGAGGCGGNVGGIGGGTTGGNPQGSSGTNEGPGTQTESPQSSSYYIVNGGFGYGGNGASTGDGYSSGVSGGAGGGGWYGGAGTYPSGSSDNQKGGAGGSGFVFTEDSVVPTEYLLSDIYHLEDASTIAGGNNSPIGLAEASIEVIDISSSYILCRDAEGIKRFNSETHEWEYIADELTPELFTEYGVYSFRSDAGLLDEYDILVNEADNISSVLFDVVPAEQHVRYETVTPMTVDRIDFDTDYDRNLFDININVTRQPRGSATKIIIDVGINKKAETSKRAKVYSGIMMSK